LGYKKRGFGKGKWLGIGGKSEVEENIEKTVVRELTEEIGVIPTNLMQVATLNFYFPYVDNPDNWNQQVCVFLIDQWERKIIGSAEIAPRWFKLDEIPFEVMWDDAKYWLLSILKGGQLRGEFLFSDQLEVKDFKILHGEY